MRGRVAPFDIELTYLPSKPPPEPLPATVGPLEFKGGPIISSPELISLFWGRFSGTEIGTMLEWLYGFAAFLSGAGAPAGQEQVAEQYGVSGAKVGVTYHDPVLPAKPVGWPEVGDEIASLVTAGNLPPATPERIFLVFSRGLFPGHAAAGWCGVHGGGGGYRIALIPYPDEEGCGASTPMASWQSIAAHEIIEAATDPDGGSGWTAGGAAGEAGDLCAWQEAVLPFGTVQLFADNLQKACSIWTRLEVAHVSVASGAANRLDVVVRGRDGGAYHKWLDGTNWGPSLTGWQNLGGQGQQFLGRPKVVSWSRDRLDVLARGSDAACYHRWWNGSAWVPSLIDPDPHGGVWQYLGGEMAGDVAAVSWAPDRLDIFCRGLAGHLYHKWWEGSRWGPGPLRTDWMSLGGIIAGNPACAAWAPGRLDVFARGLDGGIYHQWWDGLTWSGFQPIGGKMAGSPTVVSWGPNRLDVFCRGLDGAVYHKAWDGTTWKPSGVNWQSLGGAIEGDPACVASGPNRLDLFVRGLDGGCYHKWSVNGSTWEPVVRGGSFWESLGGQIVGTPAAVSWGPNRLDVLAQGTNGAPLHKWWDGTAWGPSVTDWQDLGGQVG